MMTDQVSLRQYGVEFLEALKLPKIQHHTDVVSELLIFSTDNSLPILDINLC